MDSIFQHHLSAVFLSKWCQRGKYVQFYNLLHAYRPHHLLFFYRVNLFRRGLKLRNQVILLIQNLYFHINSWCDLLSQVEAVFFLQRCDNLSRLSIYFYLGCKYILQNLKGNIKSPGYPSNYPSNLDCSWLIQAQDGYTITLKTDSFRLEGPSPSCEQDYLMIYDGHNSSANAFSSPYCARSGPTTLASSGNFMYFRFVTDSVGSFSGFNIEYRAEPSKPYFLHLHLTR